MGLLWERGISREREEGGKVKGNDLSSRGEAQKWEAEMEKGKGKGEKEKETPAEKKVVGTNLIQQKTGWVRKRFQKGRVRTSSKGPARTTMATRTFRARGKQGGEPRER